VFGSAAYFAIDLRFAMTANLLWTCVMACVRATIVPSSGKRTALVGGLTMLPLVIVALGRSEMRSETYPRACSSSPLRWSVSSSRARQLQRLRGNASWSDDDARQWWTSFRAEPRPASCAPTITITIDVGRRAA